MPNHGMRSFTETALYDLHRRQSGVRFDRAKAFPCKVAKSFIKRMRVLSRQCARKKLKPKLRINVSDMVNLQKVGKSPFGEIDETAMRM